MKIIYSPTTIADFYNNINTINKIIKEENLNKEKAHHFMERSFWRGSLNPFGTEFAAILPPISMFREDNARGNKKRVVFAKLRELFEAA